jgi:CheY-like chemotaxis protein
VQHREVTPPAREGAVAPLKILLVEDHEDSLKAMLRLLKRLGHQITTATGVGTALRAASENEFDLLISDLGLPDGTGLQLMKELLGRRPIKGIALTGYGMESDVQQTRQAGFQKHLTKPINLQELEAAIQEVA